MGSTTRIILMGLDRYAASNANSVLVADPHGGPRRAERAKQTQSTSQGEALEALGYQGRALGWFATAQTRCW